MSQAERDELAVGPNRRREDERITELIRDQREFRTDIDKRLRAMERLTYIAIGGLVILGALFPYFMHALIKVLTR